jgi:hypothetical protein|nr:MAG TPA: hypothetical protein [Caudoviricetes sp.]
MKTREREVGEGLRLPSMFYERPLTLEESQFATEHIGVVFQYLSWQGLDPGEWFDIVIFRYLLCVKRWFALPDMRNKVSFSTAARKDMRSAIHNERKKRKKEPVTVSLYDVVPGTEDLCYIDTIAAPSISF